MEVPGWRDLREFDVLLLASGIWFAGKFVRYAFPPLFPTLQVAYDASNATLGLLFSALMLAYAGMQFPSGALGDRFGRGRVITVGALVLAIAAFALFASQALPALVAAMILIGVGTGAHKTAAIDLLSRAYPSRTGRVLGVMDAIGASAGVIAPAAVVAALSTAAGWPAVFLAVGIGAAGLAVAFHVVTDRSAPPATRASDDGDDGGMGRYLAAFAEPRFAAFVAAVLAFAFAWNGLTAFLPLYLTATKGLSAERAGLLFGALFLASLVQPLTGALSDRVGRLPVVFVAMALAGAGLLGLVTTADPLLIVALVPIIGLGGHGYRPVRDSYLVASIPSAVAGGTIGVVRTIMMGAGAVAPAVVGALSEAAGFDAAFGLLLAAVGASVVVIGLLVVVGD